MNGRQNVQPVFENVNFETGLFGSRQLGSLRCLTLELALAFVRVANQPPLGGLHLSVCSFPAHENALMLLRELTLDKNFVGSLNIPKFELDVRFSVKP